MTTKTVEPIQVKQMLNRVKEERMPFTWSINPYRGCAHGCSFCYARAFQSFIGMGAQDEFQNHLFVKTNAAEALERQLAATARRLRLRPEETGANVGTVAIGTATDPYQPLEAQAKLTRACLEVLAKYRVPTTVTTRSPLILRDKDLLREMNITSINISINTLDAEATRKLEPAAPLPAKRLETVEELASCGIPTGVFLAPILPFLTDSDESLEALFAAAKSRNAVFAMNAVLRLTPDVKQWFYLTLERHYPELVASYAKLYRGAYAEQQYLSALKARVRALAGKYGLSGNVPEQPQAALPKAKPQPAEQLMFSF